MKNFNSALLALLASNQVVSRADLIEIDLPNGVNLYVNSSQWDITFGGNVYYATRNGAWQRGAITSEAAFDLRTNTMSLTVMSPTTLYYPNTQSNFMAAALLGAFDAALVKVTTLYWPENSPPPLNGTTIETKFAGMILPNGKITRSKIDFEVADMLYILNQKVPRNLVQASCRHTLGDSNCTINLNLATFNENNSVGSGSTAQNIILGTAASRTAPFYAQGFLKMTSGQNNGFTYQIKSQTGTASILLAGAMIFPVAIGDTFKMFAGCDKTEATCNSKFANLIHHGATPFVPNPETAI